VEVCCAAQGIDLRAEVAAQSETLGAVQAAVRAAVPMMNVDREVAEQIAIIDGLLPALVDVAAAHCSGLR
jgi:histidine ammonia-lyase